MWLGRLGLKQHNIATADGHSGTITMHVKAVRVTPCMITMPVKTIGVAPHSVTRSFGITTFPSTITVAIIDDSKKSLTTFAKERFGEVLCKHGK